MKINRSLRTLIPVFFTALIIFESAVYVTTTPRPREGFLVFYALDADGRTENYYPNKSSLLQIGEAVTWSIVASNQMGSLQLVDIRVKLANETITSPNDTTAAASSAPSVADFEQFILENGTWVMPFEWQILNFTTAHDGHSRIVQLQINNATYTIPDSPTCSSLSSCRFRLIFELWTWNKTDFQVGWQNGDQRRIAWLQLWFELTPSVQ